ncbi:MAG TPA: hypothetical protein DCX32_03265 [Candidatus Moranbacteria bacterium]|nr:MAG: hypothetical protein UW95_C0030G0013 [Parcubacteria group bacterium GW2011_GWC1_45_14]HAV11538.1 hypothetical protein [Candidatus Moranbacteria bacterium]
MSEKTYTEQEVQEFIRKKDEQLARQDKQIKRLKKCCLIDELTGLHRYGFLREALKRQYSSAKRNGMTMVILFMDLDHFKKINIAIGHVRGNELIRKAAKALKKSFRETDDLIRFGGDEFVAILLVHDEGEKGSEELAKIIARARDNIARVKIPPNQEFYRLGITIAGSFCKTQHSSPSKTLQEANRCLLEAKERRPKKV